MRNVYEFCPSFENENFLLRPVENADYKELLKVYSDPKAAPFFNGDNCHGDDFYYTTEKRMREAVDFWINSYAQKWFVRWVITDKSAGGAVGTIELFHRDADDYFDNCGLLRLDLRSDYENRKDIENILKAILTPAFDLFYCDKIATKGFLKSDERIAALKNCGFTPSAEKLIGHDGKEYGDYYVLEK